VETVGVLISSGESGVPRSFLWEFLSMKLFVSRTFESAFLMNGPLFGAFLAGDFRTSTKLNVW